MNRKLKQWLYLIAFGVLGFKAFYTDVVELLSPHIPTAHAKADGSLFEYQEIFHAVFSLLSTEYVEPVPREKLMEGAILGMIRAVNDPYTRYMDEDQLRELAIDTRGNFGGIGIEVTFKNNRITILTPMPGTPGMEAGLEPGDVITKIDGHDTHRISIRKAAQLLRGEPGEGVELEVKRPGVKKPLGFYIVREVIKLKVVRSTLLPVSDGKKIGYIRLEKFSGTAASDLQKHITFLKTQGLQGLVLDLRFNPGGLLEQAREVADIFLTKGKKIVYTRGRKPAMNRDFFATNETLLPDLPIVVIVNKGTASAAEIVGGALQDHKRALLIGEQTYGKGSVQTIQRLPHQKGLALTVQKYYTPSGRLIHERGLKPDLIVKSDIFTVKEKPFLRKMHQLRLLPKFAQKHSDFDFPTRNIWIKELKKNQINISKNTAFFLLKSELARRGKTEFYDLEYDKALIAARDQILKDIK